MNHNYGFIITRHVNSEKTNHYWNHCVTCIQTFYPNKKIVIIDDNSKQELIKPYKAYQNLVVVQSEFPGRGELLPYYYYYKNKWFDNAVIIHDSVFLNKRVNFELISAKVLPLWHFPSDEENLQNTLRIIGYLSNNYELFKNINNEHFFQLSKKWNGCFGVQSYINHGFLVKIMNKYNLTNLLNAVKTRPDRCCLERIMGVIFFLEKKNTNNSLFGNIRTYYIWGITFEDYLKTLKIKKNTLPIIKVWSGR